MTSQWVLIYKGITAHNWQKWKSRFLTCHCHEIYREEAVGLKSFQLCFENYNFCEYVKFGAISWKFDILSITALKLNLTLLLHICDSFKCDYLPHTKFRFHLIDLQLNIDFPSQFCIFYRKITLSYSKIGFSRKWYLLRRAKTCCLFPQSYGLK